MTRPIAARPPERHFEPLRVFDCPLEGIRLVEASAGTGKTWNICALYLRLLLERGIDAPGILVVTFSIAATAELRDRIRDRLLATRAVLRSRLHAAPVATTGNDPFVLELLAHLASLASTPRADGAIALDEASLLQRIERALETFDEAAIYTIHGFCQRALADAPFGARLPLQLEQAADGPLIEQIATDFWRRYIAAPDASPVLAAWLVSTGDSPQRWATALKLRLGRPLSQLAWPDAIAGEAFERAALDSGWQAVLSAWAAARAAWAPQVVARRVQDHQPRLHQKLYAVDRLQAALASWEQLLVDEDPAAIARAVFGKAVDEAERKRLALLGSDSLIRLTRKGEPAIDPHPFFDAVDAFLAASKGLSETGDRQRLRLLATFLDEGAATLRGLKREHRQIAFDDMLSNLHRRLHDLDGHDGTGAALAALLRQRFPAALIDEFQDTDPQQFAIFDSVYGSSGLPLFFVGDPKQAIYGFRGADLPTYLQARGRAAARYTLASNQRATPRLIVALEALLNRNDRAFVQDGLDYQPVTAGSRPRSVFVEPASGQYAGSDGAALRLWQLPIDNDGPIAKSRAPEAAARACAAEVVRLLAGGLDGTITIDGRPLQGGDIAILVPKHAWGRLMRRQLAERGVPSVELSQDSVFASTDAEDLARILAAIDRPARRGLVLAALATDAMGVDAPTLADIHDDDARLGEVMARFAGYREHWRQHGIASLLRRWIRDEGVATRLLGRADGERRMTNLTHLAEALQQASIEQPGPDALLRWFEAQRDTAADVTSDTAQLRLESDRHLVQILTIHRAKGLEFPVVFCPFSWDGGSKPAAGGDGQPIHGLDGRGLIVFRELTDDEKQHRRLEEAAEQVRLLYVALTRAVHRCYLVVGCYTSSRSTKESCRSPLNWLAAGAGIAVADWFAAREPALDGDQIETAWESLATAAPEAISMAPLPEPPFAILHGRLPDADSFAALDPPSRIPPARWVGSYSSLTQGAAAEAAARDHDLFITEADGPDPAPAEDDILLFARGPVAGECLHAVFEHADFTDPDTWPAAIERALRAHPQVVPAQGETAARARLARLLGDVVATPLPSTGLLTLERIDRRHRLDEFEFMLPAAALHPPALAALLEHHGFPSPTLTTATLAGWLRGFIDLVFEHDGRYGLLDWKSNHLGPRRSDYGQAPMAAAMAHHDYHLQALLYTVALHRYLGQRLDDYRYDRHFGGYYYLFVRGVRPGWRDAEGHATGVVHVRPDEALIVALDALFDTTADRGAAGNHGRRVPA